MFPFYTTWKHQNTFLSKLFCLIIAAPEAGFIAPHVWENSM